MGDAQVAHATLRGVTRVYPGVTPVHALGPLDLDLARGEFFTVVGPSGITDTHAYANANAGTYTVTLTAIDQHGI